MSELDKAVDNQIEANQWGLWLHFSQLLGYMIPLIGLVAPIIIWQLKKNQYPVIDEHGRNVINWIISALLYAAICLPLTLIFIGIPLLILLSLFCLLFPIVGGIKANNGIVWKYPLTINFIV
jgi:uncharacterized Tic20 family protein